MKGGVYRMLTLQRIISDKRQLISLFGQSARKMNKQAVNICFTPIYTETDGSCPYSP